MQKNVSDFYVLVFCVDFMSEKDIQFNKDDVPVVTEAEKKLLMEIFNQFNSCI